MLNDFVISLKQEAAENAVEKMIRRLEKGYGCAIAIDGKGNFGKATNCPLMLWASMKEGVLASGLERRQYLGS